MQCAKLKDFRVQPVLNRSPGPHRLQNVDLNLLYLFQVLYEEKNVSRAAQRLFLTPSAVSHSLRRLRIMMSDVLFKRGVGGLIPTPRANEIARRLQGILPQIAEALAPAEFEPSRTTRVFAISCVPYLTSVFVPTLAARFQEAASAARLEVRLLYGSVIDDLDSGILDVALGNFRRTPPRLVTEDLLEDATLWVMRASHPHVDKRLTLRMLGSLPHIDILIGGAVSSVFDSYEARHGLERLVVQNNLAAVEAALAEAGLRRDVRWTAPDSFTAMCIAASSDGVALVPASAARLFAGKLGLVAHEPPYPSAPLTVQILYHAESGERPAIRWLLDLIRRTAACMA